MQNDYFVGPSEVETQFQRVPAHFVTTQVYAFKQHFLYSGNHCTKSVV